MFYQFPDRIQLENTTFMSNFPTSKLVFTMIPMAHEGNIILVRREYPLFCCSGKDIDCKLFCSVLQVPRLNNNQKHNNYRPTLCALVVKNVCLQLYAPTGQLMNTALHQQLINFHEYTPCPVLLEVCQMVAV